jgi:PilZ domain
MPSVVYETGTPSFEQRIGARLPVGGIEITWLEATGATRNGRQEPQGRPGLIVDASVSGAAVRGPARLLTGADGDVLIRYQDEESEVVVHRSQPTDDPSMRLYGVEFVQLKPLLRARIYAAVAPEGESPTRWDLES